MYNLKTSLALLCALFISIAISHAQTVSGSVTDRSGLGLPGVNIQVKGTIDGTSTDIDGRYSLSASDGDTLLYSFLGMVSEERVVSGSVLDITMAESFNYIDEVVVTAFGIKKETRELGYSVSKVESKDLNLAGQPNAITALQGRVAGLQINQTSGSSGGGVDILIRGVTSVDPSRNNQPLIIVDGLALNNETFAGEVRPSAGSNSVSSAEQFAFTNRGADINPEDIESYTVLKGAAATALYGIRASNGAIIIETKKGQKGKAKVSLSASTSIRDIKTTPTFQDVYREGWDGRVELLYTPETESGFTSVFNSTAFHTWGPKYSDDSVENPDGNIIDLTNDRFYDPYELFQTSVNRQVNMSISGAGDKMDYFFSMGSNNEKGVLPNTDYDKITFRFKSGYKVADNFNINTSIAYTKSGGRRANGGDKSVFSSLSFYSPTFPINDFQNADGSQRNFSMGITDNPRYFLETSNLLDDVNRWIGNTTLSWAPKDWINVTYSAQIDNFSDQRNRFVPPDLDVGTQVGGFIVEQDVNFTGLESNLFIEMNKEIASDLSATLTLGNQISDTKTDFTSVRGETLNVPGINDIANTINIFASNSVTQLRNVGVFGELKFDYKNRLFLSITGRNDWVSTLPQENRSFFYPSFSLAYDIQDLFGDRDVFSFGKLRASWAEVGKGPVFGRTGRFFVADGDFPFGGAGGFRLSTREGDLNTIPEKNQSLEFGVDLRFFTNRIRLDYAYFKTNVKSQIFDVGTAPSSGISALNRNAGNFQTQGHELLLSAYLIRNSKLSWETFINFSTNEGRVVDLPDDIEAVVFADAGFAGVTSEVREGDEMGSLYGWRWRYEDGQRYIGEDGLPRVNLDERQKVGNAFPDFIAAIGNNLNYNNIGFNFLLEWKKGGDLYDSGRRNSIRNGVLGLTEFRNENTVLEGVMDDGSGGFTTNIQEVFIDQNYYRSSTRYNRASEILVQDASWIKLRNVSLSYRVKEDLLNKINVESMSLSVSAANLLLWTPFEGFDPEGSQFSAGSNVYGFTGFSTPVSETYSFGILLGF